jgi:hypothetical protein
MPPDQAVSLQKIVLAKVCTTVKGVKVAVSGNTMNGKE